MRKGYFKPAVGLLLALFLLNGCSLKDIAQDSVGNDAVAAGDGENTPDPEGSDKEEALHFVDAAGEWHDAVINPDVPKHDYDLSQLTVDKESVHYEDDRYTVRKGIDVSHHQGDIDWKKVREDGIEFAFLRIVYRGYGESGSLNEDREYKNYIEQAKAAGIDVGVYVFSQAINEAEAVAEAELTLDLLKGYDLELPVVFDPESIKNDEARTDNVSGEQFTRNTIAFCDRIEAAGYDTMVYCNMVWQAEMFQLEKLNKYPIWYADYELVPQTPYRFDFWQYSESGTVDGIEGGVDLDVQFLKK